MPNRKHRSYPKWRRFALSKETRGLQGAHREGWLEAESAWDADEVELMSPRLAQVPHRKRRRAGDETSPPPSDDDEASPQFSREHFQCFDDRGLVVLEKAKQNSSVVETTLAREKDLLERSVSECLALERTDVSEGVKGILSKLEVLFGLKTIFSDVAPRNQTIERIAAKMLELNQTSASPLMCIANSRLFKLSNRCVVFVGENAVAGARRLLGLFKMRPPRTAPPNLNRLISGSSNSWPLVILDAESGSGKTTTCTWLANEVKLVDRKTQKLRCVMLIVLSSDLKEEKDHVNRRKYLQKILVEAFQEQLDQLKAKTAKEGFRQATWYVAFDEVSRIPNLLRTLCVERMAIAMHLEERFYFAANSVRILAAGTGSSGTVAPGSFPEHYNVVTLLGQGSVAPPGNCTREKFLTYFNPNQAEEFDSEVTRAMWAKMIAIPYIAQAVNNPRFAECLMERCHEVTKNLSKVHPAMITRGMIDAVISLSCIRFKELNGCSKLNRKNMMKVVAQTVKYAIVPRLATNTPPNFETFGMGRDVVEVQATNEVVEKTHFVIQESLRFKTDKGKRGKHQSDDQTYALVVPKSHNRFRVSKMQWSLIALGYGRGEPNPHWEDFEQAAALFLRINMIGLQGETVWQALLTFSGTPVDGNPFDGTFNVFGTAAAGMKATFEAAKATRLSYTRVACWTETTKFQKSTFVFDPRAPRGGKVLDAQQAGNTEKQKLQAFEARAGRKEILGRLRAVLEANLGAVIVNAPMASFADVIFISRELVVLVQAKFYGPCTSFNAADVVNEIQKCGVLPPDTWLTDLLQALWSPLNIEPPLVVCGIMTTKDRIDLRGNAEFPMVMQWSVKNGFVMGSKVRFRFPQPQKKEKLLDLTVVDATVGTVMVEEPEEEDAEADPNEDLSSLSSHFCLGP